LILIPYNDAAAAMAKKISCGRCCFMGVSHYNKLWKVKTLGDIL